jgi:hypothetical protein
MIKRASASRKVAPSEASRPGSVRLFFLALPALGGKVSPGQLTSSAARGAVSTATAASREKLCSCVDHLREGNGADCAYKRGIGSTRRRSRCHGRGRSCPVRPRTCHGPIFAGVD